MISLTSNKSDSKNLEKLNLWKSSYALFGKYSTFEGPLYTEGYREKKIGIQISRDGNKFVDIDIFSVKENGDWIGIELTTDPLAKKDTQLSKYDAITSDELKHKTALEVSDNKTVMLFDTSHIESKYPQITFDSDSKVYTHNLSKIIDESMRNRLESLNGTTIPMSPSISFTMAPESSPYEVKTALVPIVQQILTGKIKSITAEEIVDNCLSIIRDEISASDRKGLISITKSAMLDLCQHYIPNLIQVNDNCYSRTDKKILFNSTFYESTTKIIDTWVHSKNHTQTFLDTLSEKVSS